MADQTVTIKQIAAALGVTRQAAEYRARKEHWPYEVTHVRGGLRKDYYIASLPEDLRLELGRAAHSLYNDSAPTPALPLKGRGPINNRGADAAALAQQRRIEGPQGRGAGGANPPAVRPSSLALSSSALSPSRLLPDWQRSYALAKADLLAEYIAARAASNGEGKVRAGQNFLDYYNAGGYPGIFSILGKRSYPTLENWRRAASLADPSTIMETLAPAWGNRRGDTMVTPEQMNILLGFYLNPNKFHVSEAILWARRRMIEMGMTDLPSDGTLRRKLKEFEHHHYDQVVFTRQGEKALNDKCLPPLSRDWDALQVGDCLIADGHDNNFTVVNPYTGKPCRATLLLWYDGASRYPAGWQIMPTENTQCVLSAYRRAILRLGKYPKAAYLDNGKAFRSRFFNDPAVDFMDGRFGGIFARTNTDVYFAWVRHGQSKPVERFFGTYGEFERLMPTYVGNSIANKPAHLLQGEALHKALHRRQTGGYVPTIPEIDRAVSLWFDDYAQRPHKGLGGRTPLEVWEAGRGPGVNEDDLRDLMMAVETKLVRRAAIHLFGREYRHEALYGLSTNVIVRYELEDLSRVHCHHQDGTFLCTAEPLTKVHPLARTLGTVEDLEAVKTAIRAQRSLKKQTVAPMKRYLEQLPPLPLLSPPPPGEGQGGGTYHNPVHGGGPGRGNARPLSQFEREEIERGAESVVNLTPTEQQPVFGSKSERYVWLLERRFKGTILPEDDIAWMDTYSQTRECRLNADWHRTMMEYWDAQLEEQEARQ